MKIRKNEIELHNGGYWCGGSYYQYKGVRLCSDKNPTIHLTNYNENEVFLRRVLPNIEGAKCLYKQSKPWYKYDCYDRAIPCGSVTEEIWDLRDTINCNKSLGELLDYEECCMLGIEDEFVSNPN